MGVHIYSGSLVRFYTHDWQNEIQRFARERGFEYKSSGGPQRWPTREEACAHLAWMRTALVKRFGELDWNDDVDGYDTVKLHQEGRDAIALVAAHLHRPDLPMPDELPEDMYADAAYAEAGPRRYLVGPIAAFDASVIIPGDFDELLFLESPLREQVLVCSTTFLRNALTFVARGYWSDGTHPDAWLARGLPFGRGSGDRLEGSLRADAEFAFGAYSRMLNFSAQHKCAISVW